MHTHYGINVARYLGTPELSWRKFEMLLGDLPRDSRLQVSIYGEPPESWSTDQHLLASLIDATMLVQHAIYQHQSTKTIPRPRPMRRPGESANDDQSMIGAEFHTIDEVKRLLARPRIDLGKEVVRG